MEKHEFRVIFDHYIAGLPHRDRVICISPFREETHASFDINFTKCLWWDFGLGKGGSAYDFIMEAEQCSFKQARSISSTIIGECSVQPPRFKYAPGEKQSSNSTGYLKPLALYSLDREQYAQFDNGKLIQRGISYETLKEYRVFMEKSALIIPYEISDNVAHSYKSMFYSGGNKEIKTLGRATLYPIRSLYKSTIVVCEGELDALALLSHGINAITGTAGCSTFKQEWGWAMSGKSVTILYDNDDPGRAGAEKVKEVIKDYARCVKIASFPENYKKGYDVSDHFIEGRTADELRRIISEGRKY